jgi:hypothetical protein
VTNVSLDGIILPSASSAWEVCEGYKPSLFAVATAVAAVARAIVFLIFTSRELAFCLTGVDEIICRPFRDTQAKRATCSVSLFDNSWPPFTFQEVGDDGLSCSFLKFLKFHRQVNSIQNGIVELLDQIGG